ncbi:MAG: hypothetical protein ACK559_11575, partial [bacterium]
VGGAGVGRRDHRGHPPAQRLDPALVQGQQLEVVAALIRVVVGAEQVPDHALGAAEQARHVPRRDRALPQQEGPAQRPQREQARPPAAAHRRGGRGHRLGAVDGAVPHAQRAELELPQVRDHRDEAAGAHALEPRVDPRGVQQQQPGVPGVGQGGSRRARGARREDGARMWRTGHRSPFWPSAHAPRAG